MKISAQVQSSEGRHHVTLCTNDHVHSLAIQAKPDGLGSSVNGGELLFLALATCYCNDLYREAAKRGMPVESVEVEVTGDFSGEGSPASNLSYRVKVAAKAKPDEIDALIRHTDRVAEIQNTLRRGTMVKLDRAEAVCLA